MMFEQFPENYFQSEEFLAREKRRQEITAELVEKGSPFMTAVVIAGDIQSAEEATKSLEAGGDPMELYKHIGSYGRFEWCVKNLPKKELLKLLPELWMSCDPDDSDPEYLKLWREAYAANGHKTICDNKRKRLPKGNSIKVYRGQIGRELSGISWSLDIEIAQKFAITGGGRAPVAGGVILAGWVNPKDVLAYITARGEAELIIPPNKLRHVHTSHHIEFEKK